MTVGATTPPRDGRVRPRVVLAAGIVWVVLGVLLVVVAGLFVVALAVPAAADPGTSGLSLVASTLVLLAAGAVAVVGAVTLLRASARPRTRRLARAALTALGVVLAVVGIVQLTFLGVGGPWCVASVVGVLLLHVPAARRWFAPRGAAVPDGR